MADSRYLKNERANNALLNEDDLVTLIAISGGKTSML
jgi:hypothetical protein